MTLNDPLCKAFNDVDIADMPAIGRDPAETGAHRCSSRCTHTPATDR